MATRTDFGHWGGPVPLFDAFDNWREHRLSCLEAGINPRTNKQFDTRILEALATDNRMILEASPDTKADFATFMWEPVQASFYDAYELVEAQWDRYVGITSVNSFDEVKIKGRNSLTGIGYVGELGEFPGMRRTFRPEAAIVVDTYGGTYSMTRKLLRSAGIDKIIADQPGEMGEAMGDFITRMIIAMIVANPTAPDGQAMYSAGRGNLSTTPIGIDSIVDAAVWMRTRKDPDGRPMKLQLKTAVTQNDRAALLLRQAVKSQYLQIQTGGQPESASKFGRGTANPIQDSGIIPADGIVIDPWLPDAQNIYYFGDPARRPAFLTAFLDGQRRPFVGMTDATVMHLANSNGNGFDPYSFPGQTLEWWTRQDVGVTAVEPLSTYLQAPA